MSATSKGFLLVLMQPPPAFEEEFNAWYDTEHVPERLAVPGFETGLRYVCISGAPRYLAHYDLASPAVLDSSAYHAVSGANFSPWTRRVTARVAIYRAAGRQLFPGDALTGRAARVLLARFRGLDASAEAAVVEGMRQAFARRPEVRQVRVLAHDTGAGIDYLGFVEAHAPLDDRLEVASFGAAAGGLDLVNIYAPLQPHG